MDDEIKKMLEDEIKAEIQNLSTLKSGSDEKKAAIANLSALYQLRMEDVNAELNYLDKCNKCADLGNQLAERAKDRYFRLGIEAAGIVLPLIFYATWMRKGFKFEETGTYTSTTFKGLFNRFKPTNKN